VRAPPSASFNNVHAYEDRDEHIVKRARSEEEDMSEGGPRY
jgi:hypothetical protein